MATAATLPVQTSEVVPFHFTVPIAKVDAEKRLVTGIVTQEVLDKQGDIVDYETAKAFFMDDALWPGNMREMHQPKAVGKKVSVECDDDTKSIILTARVSKGAPDTWEKVLDGTLSFYSIGGNGERVTEKLATGGTAKRLFLKSLAETSFVDNGACPTAKFEIVKTVDGALVDAQPDEPTDEAEEADDLVAKVDAVLDVALTPTVTRADIRARLAKLYDLRHDAAAVLAEKTAVVGVAKAAGLEAALPTAWVAVAKSGPEVYDIEMALSAIAVLERLLSAEYWDARYTGQEGQAPDPVKVAQVGLLKTAIDAVLRFLVSEHDEQFTDGLDGRGPQVSGDDAVAMFEKSLDVVRKAGARNRKSDRAMIQKVHDLSEQLGAACAAATEKSVDIVALATENTHAALLKAAGWLAPADATLSTTYDAAQTTVSKLTADLAAANAKLLESEAAVTKAVETVAALDARLTQLEGSPAPGGPVRHAHVAPVDKSLGGPNDAAAGATAEADAVLSAFDVVAKTATTESERMDVAMRKANYMLSHNIGRVDLVTGRPVAS